MFDELVFTQHSAATFIEEKVKNIPDFEDDAFIVTDISEIQKRCNKWKTSFPGIQPFYALKAQNNSLTTALLAANGCGFDVASLEEAKSVTNAGVSSTNIVYSQPHKKPSHIVHALKHRLLSVCDTADEIEKIREIADKIKIQAPIEILLRILPDDENDHSIFSKLSSKFGAPIQNLPLLVKTARKNDVVIKGIHFHVGSGCHSSGPFVKTLKLSRRWWDALENSWGCRLTVLDIGGGFPGEDTFSSNGSFDDLANKINEGLKSYFGDILNRIRVIAEPGQFFVLTSQSIVCNIMTKKNPSTYVLNTGIYGGFSLSAAYHALALVSVPYVVWQRLKNGSSLNCNEDFNKAAVGECNIENNDLICNQGKSVITLWGPACNTLDKIVANTKRLEGISLQRGDWLVFPNLGAYMDSFMTNFNGYRKPATFFVCTPPYSEEILRLLF